METRIKRVAQFLFDNAGMIVTELKKSRNYRSLSVNMDFFKYEGGDNLGLEMKFYDSTAKHLYLANDAICLQRFEQLCSQMNDEAGVNPPPEPEPVRDTL